MEQKATIQQNWFKDRKWGIFIHYLSQMQNGEGDFHNTVGHATDWNTCVEMLDTDLLASRLAEIRAGYLVFTMMQGSKYFCAPNETYERMTGLARGEGTCRRDLIADLIKSLDRYDIPLFLYYTGDGTYMNPEVMQGLYGRAAEIGSDKDHVTLPFAQKWAAIMEEYAVRYGDKIKGWWVDGMYPSIGYENFQYLELYKNAARKGNPDALFAANYYGCFDDTKPWGEEHVEGVGNVIFAPFYHELAPATPVCDYTAGEVVSLDVYPHAQLLNGAQTHILSFLGIPKHPIEVYGGWGMPGCKYSEEYLKKYVKQVNDLGGVVSLDVCMYRDGRIDGEQLAVLKRMAQA